MNKKVGEEDFMKNKYFDETAMNVNSDAVIKRHCGHKYGQKSWRRRLYEEQIL